MEDALKTVLTEIQHLKNRILGSSNKTEMIELLEQLVKLASEAVSLTTHDNKASGFVVDIQRKSLQLLRADISSIQSNVNAPLEAVHFQVSTSILMFMLAVIPNGTYEGNIFIDALYKKYVAGIPPA